MLLRLKISNLFSFNEEVSFDMFPNLALTSFSEHIYTQYEVPLLKQAILYGSNGSGKSNFLKALDFLIKFVVDKNFLTSTLVQRSKFRLQSGVNRSPICISIEFEHHNCYYLYDIQIGSEGVELESLALSSLNKNNSSTLFKRTHKDIDYQTVTAPEIVHASTKLLAQNPFASLLSLNNEFPLIVNPQVDNASLWFTQNIQVLTINRSLPTLINWMRTNPDLLAFANNIFSHIDAGIESVQIKSRKLRDALGEDKLEELADILNEEFPSGRIRTQMENNTPLHSITEEDGEKMLHEFVFKQTGVQQAQINMSIDTQSEGTIRILNLIPAFFQVITTPKVFCIDEIENSIHPKLMHALIRYFTNTASKGQLIFTTHDMKLLDSANIVRPDEVWFVEKDEGCSRLYTLNDFQEHDMSNIELGYWEGRYGAVPIIDSFD